MRVLVLGPLDVVGASASAPRGEVARRVLAVLAAHANRPIPADRLSDLVWPDADRPAGNSLQAHISRWRKVLGAHRITFAPPGYTLALGPDQLDALQFEEVAREAIARRDTGDLAAGITACDDALELWRGPAFDGLDDHDCVRVRRTELEALRADVELARLEMLCATNAFDQVVSAATVIGQTDPWNEPVHRILARAHYGRGDQVAALGVLRDLEARLRQDLGLDPGVPTQWLREQILRHEPALDAGAAGSTEPTITSIDRMGERIAELPALTQQVLRAAALSGTDVDTAQVGRALTVAGPALADALAPALKAGIVIRTDTGVRFASQPVHEAVADLVPPGEALDLHRRLGEGLLSRQGAGTLVRAADHLAAAAGVDSGTAVRAALLDHRLARQALAQGRHHEAIVHARRALVSATHVAADDLHRLNRAALRFTLADAHQRVGDLMSALDDYAAVVESPDVADDVVIRAALAYEECSMHARRHRTGPHDRSILMLDTALAIVGADDPVRVDLLAARAQALMFSGLDEQAADQGDLAVAEARRLASREVLARTLLRRLAVHGPDDGAADRLELAREAAELSREGDADELELEALCAWVPELMRADDVAGAEGVIARIERLGHVEGNVVHRYKVPMWRAALAIWFRRLDEAQVLIEDFRELATQDGYDSTDRVYGFQSILLALARGDTDLAAKILSEYDQDRDFEPWRAATLLVAHACGDTATVHEVLVPWSARRFALSQPFAGVQTFCACLVAQAVAEHGDAEARKRLGVLVARGVGQNQVLGAGAAILGDAAQSLAILRQHDDEEVACG